MHVSWRARDPVFGHLEKLIQGNTTKREKADPMARLSREKLMHALVRQGGRRRLQEWYVDISDVWRRV